jgi:hypothetical protein
VPDIDVTNWPPIKGRYGPAKNVGRLCCAGHTGGCGPGDPELERPVEIAGKRRQSSRNTGNNVLISRRRRTAYAKYPKQGRSKPLRSPHAVLLSNSRIITQTLQAFESRSPNSGDNPVDNALAAEDSSGIVPASGLCPKNGQRSNLLNTAGFFVPNRPNVLHCIGICGRQAGRHRRICCCAQLGPTCLMPGRRRPAVACASGSMLTDESHASAESNHQIKG